MWGAENVFSIYYLTYSSWLLYDASLIIFMSQMWKLKPRMLSNLPKLSIKGKWRSQNLSPDLSSFKVLTPNCSSTLSPHANYSYWRLGNVSIIWGQIMPNYIYKLYLIFPQIFTDTSGSALGLGFRQINKMWIKYNLYVLGTFPV